MEFEFSISFGIRCFYDKNILDYVRFYIHMTGDDDDDDGDDGGADGNNFEDAVVVRKLDIEPPLVFLRRALSFKIHQIYEVYLLLRMC